ncbi:MAG: polymer-forming cytoskeletal protein [Deltaproteobacteria bacterium]|nr:polymer-forming cytoskeletal protein [Deltaproteobacteria bacterium]
MADGPYIIGRGIHIKGTLSGAEDLIVEGTIDGHISLKNELTVMHSGVLSAEISTHSLVAHGKVSGSIDADDLVSLTAEANVVADIRAPRVVIEDGARFKGRIEMDVELPDNI